MMYANLFNPKYKPNLYNREWHIYYQARYNLKNILKSCKTNNLHHAKEEIDYFRGALRYMLSVGDIDGMTWDILYGITRQIVKKYNLFYQ